ncbi:hypothetical protein Pla52o_58040 [Novipirellula galeiformis]|uniref:Uncharacterized protein n=1 Tax=Novipirellula galeiformis TaxID=2528004 RepID=A0A5C6BEG3_9BACT|nr:hypothetical protein Pla52o_58040 [Novipirellula galeiformis]
MPSSLPSQAVRSDANTGSFVAGQTRCVKEFTLAAVPTHAPCILALIRVAADN